MSNLREKIEKKLRAKYGDLIADSPWTEVCDMVEAAISSEPAAVPVERKAPVQGYQAGIPWSLHLEAYDVYAKKYGTSQTAERLAERGGFGARELDEHIPGWREKVSTIADLQARLEAAEKDAARYRWLRDVSVPPHNFYLSVPIEFDGVKYSPSEVDEAIDAALSKKESTK